MEHVDEGEVSTDAAEDLKRNQIMIWLAFIKEKTRQTQTNPREIILTSTWTTNGAEDRRWEIS